MPLPLPQATPPYAYVIEARPFDRCRVPDCAIKSRDVVGWADELQSDGDPGSYVRFGELNNEMFFRRAVVLRPGETFAFDLPARPFESEIDAYLSGAQPGEAHASMRIEERAIGEAPRALLEKRYDITTQKFERRTSLPEFAHEENFFTHLREQLPERKKPVRVIFRNEGQTPLALASPLVMDRVEGRGPRQIVMFVDDAVPGHELEALFTGNGLAQDPALGVSKMVRDLGAYFPNGTVPDMNTATFSRRVWRPGPFQADGEPALVGQGYDEDPPDVVASEIARVGEHGFVTQAFMANFTLMPAYTRAAFDGSYQNELITKPLYHPQMIEDAYARWLTTHAHDDSFVVIWNSVTHSPYGEGRAGPPPPPVPGVPLADVSPQSLKASWKNLLETTDHVLREIAYARATSPDAQRLIVMGTDHGSGLTATMTVKRYFLLPGTPPKRGAQHGVFASREETHTPFVWIYDGVWPEGERNGLPHGTISSQISVLSTWRAIELAFHTDLSLPQTSLFDSPILSKDAYFDRWQDDVAGAIGDAGAMRFVRGAWAYRGFEKILAGPIWSFDPAAQLLFGGSPIPSTAFLGEELYDDTQDPYELHNIAADHPEVVLDMRRDATDWLATYFDPPDHPRRRFTIWLASPKDLVIEAPVPFRVRVDEAEKPLPDARVQRVRGHTIEIEETSAHVGIISLRSPDLAEPLLVRCAKSRQPLDRVDAVRPKLNMDVVATNCVEPETHATARPGEALVSVTVLRRKTAGAASSSALSDELLEGLRRWGYVRDIDKKKP